jgi:hypothetical protein
VVKPAGALLTLESQVMLMTNGEVELELAVAAVTGEPVALPVDPAEGRLKDGTERK